MLLRTISKSKWYSAEWLAEGHVPADALTDLRTQENELSVWFVDGSDVTLRSVLTALAAERQNLSKVDYALIDEAVLPVHAIRWKRSEGSTPHDVANKSWHRDLTELTASKVVQLATSMRPLAERPHVRIPEKKIKEMLLEALESGSLDRARMHPSLLRDLGPRASD